MTKPRLPPFKPLARRGRDFRCHLATGGRLGADWSELALSPAPLIKLGRCYWVSAAGGNTSSAPFQGGTTSSSPFQGGGVAWGRCGAAGARPGPLRVPLGSPGFGMLQLWDPPTLGRVKPPRTAGTALLGAVLT